MSKGDNRRPEAKGSYVEKFESIDWSLADIYNGEIRKHLYGEVSCDGLECNHHDCPGCHE